MGNQQNYLYRVMPGLQKDGSRRSSATPTRSGWPAGADAQCRSETIER